MVLAVAIYANASTEQQYERKTVYTLDKHYFGGDDLIVWAWLWPVPEWRYQWYGKVTPEVFEAVRLFEVCTFTRYATDTIWSGVICFPPENRVFLPVLQVR